MILLILLLNKVQRAELSSEIALEASESKSQEYDGVDDESSGCSDCSVSLSTIPCLFQL